MSDGAIDILILVFAFGSLIMSGWVGSDGFWRRSLSVVAVLFGATLIVSGMLRLVPGDPVENILGDQAPQESRDALAKDLGLVGDDGQPVGFVGQYGKFMRGVMAAGCFAMTPEDTHPSLAKRLPKELMSFRSRQPVREIIAVRLGRTAILAFLAMLIAVTLGPSLGVLAASKPGGRLDALSMAFAITMVAIPRFWFGPLTILLFAVSLGWLPISGIDDGARSYVLPALCLGTALAAVLARFSRASLLEVMHQDYIRTARAKGLSERTVLWRHGLKNALIPVLTIIGLQFGAVLAGAVVTEKIFVFPGIGLLLFESIMSLDLPVVQGCILLIASAYVFANVGTDLMYRWVDPRMRNREGQ